MPRLIDADKTIGLLKTRLYETALNNATAVCEASYLYTECADNRIETWVDEMPTVDAEPVVRCDDCIYRDGKTPGQPNILCWQMHNDDYCSYGTKREVGTYCEDIVSVVRCKDCIYYGDHGDGEMECAMMILYPNKPTDYCSLGVRREDAKTD